MQKIQQFPSWFSKQKLGGKVAIGCAGIIMLCCLCSVPYAILNPSTPTPIAQNTSVALVESSPIAAQTESVAEVIPTLTPKPTNTLKPTNTPLHPTPTQNPTITDEPTKENSQEIITVYNNEEFAAVLNAKEPGDQIIKEFAVKYAGRTIEFDGNIAYMNHHGDYTTRYDFLISPWDYSETSIFGPYFQFVDCNYDDLNLIGNNAPDSVRMGDNLHFVAKIIKYNETQQLFFLDPISTEAR